MRDKFPACEHALRLGTLSEPLDLVNYLPRIWFVSKEQNMLIQIQDDRFLFNWRRMQVQNKEAYPRYSKIIEAFKTNLRIFQRFLEEEKLESVKPKKCELTYVNHIPKGEDESPVCCLCLWGHK